MRATGYHYAIALDPSSLSYGDGILSDWGFEEDLELLNGYGSREHTEDSR